MEDKEIKEKAASAIVSEAEAVAKSLVDTAARAAARMTDETNEQKMTKVLANALREVFGEHESSQRFIDTAKVPIICKDIATIRETIKEIKDEMVSQDVFWPIKILVYSGVGIVLTAVVGAIVALVINNHQ